jgi:hypothetical protein
LLAEKYQHDNGYREIVCPFCSAIIVFVSRSKLTTGPIAQAILQRQLFKHWRVEHAAQGEGKNTAVNAGH